MAVLNHRKIAILCRNLVSNFVKHKKAAFLQFFKKNALLRIYFSKKKFFFFWNKALIFMIHEWEIKFSHSSRTSFFPARPTNGQTSKCKLSLFLAITFFAVYTLTWEKGSYHKLMDIRTMKTDTDISIPILSNVILIWIN